MSSTVKRDTATKVSTLPVITQCHINKAKKQVEMMVAIRDPDNLITANLNNDNHDVLEVEHDLDDEFNDPGVCKITKSGNSLDYFKVSFVNYMTGL